MNFNVNGMIIKSEEIMVLKHKVNMHVFNI